MFAKLFGGGAPLAKISKEVNDADGISNNKIDEDQMEFTLDAIDFIKNPELDSGAKRINISEEVEAVA